MRGKTPVDVQLLLTLSEAATLTALSASHLRMLARQEKIWSLKRGKTWLTTEAAIRTYLATQPKSGPKPSAS